MRRCKSRALLVKAFKVGWQERHHAGVPVDRYHRTDTREGNRHAFGWVNRNPSSGAGRFEWRGLDDTQARVGRRLRSTHGKTCNHGTDDAVCPEDVPAYERAIDFSTTEGDLTYIAGLPVDGVDPTVPEPDNSCPGIAAVNDSSCIVSGSSGNADRVRYTGMNSMQVTDTCRLAGAWYMTEPPSLPAVRCVPAYRMP